MLKLMPMGYAQQEHGNKDQNIEEFSRKRIDIWESLAYGFVIP